ncbi:MAG: putative Ig domain-containing protein [Clostridiales bacterium]|nr:putative Ig domain-containing protein [Clostridiales bacterium]
MKTRKLLALLISLIMIFALLPATVTMAETLTFDIIQISDLHGGIASATNVNLGSRLATQIRAVQNANPTGTILLGGGDMFQGTPVSNFFYGTSTTEWMNYMKFDAMVVGNHEFDWGLDVFEYETVKDAEFQYYCSNIRWRAAGVDGEGKPHAAGELRFKPYVIVEKKGIKFAIVGNQGASPNTIAAVMHAPYTFQSAAQAVRDAVAQMATDGVSYDFLIINTHDGTGLTSLRTEFPKLIAVLGGHSHSGTASVSSGLATGIGGNSASGYIRAQISVNTDTMAATVNSCTWTAASTTNTPDAGSLAIVNKYLNDKRYTDIMNERVGYANPTTTISNSNVRARVWACEAMAYAAGADIGMTNSGGLRSAGIPILSGGNATVGNIPFGSLLGFMPFDNFTAVIELTYDETIGLMNAMQQANTALLSGGVYCAIDSTRAAGNRVVGLYRADGTQYPPGQNIKIAVTDFVLNGGDSFNFFTNRTIVRDGVTWTIQNWANENDCLKDIFPRDAFRTHLLAQRQPNGDFKNIITEVFRQSDLFSSARWNANVQYAEEAKRLLADTVVATSASQVAVGKSWVTQPVYDILQNAYNSYLATPVAVNTPYPTTLATVSNALNNTPTTTTSPIGQFKAAMQVGTASTVQFQLLTTSDVHGAYYHANYNTGTKNTARTSGMTRIATLVNTRRAAVPNTILVDNGDTFQGTPMTSYFMFNRPDLKDVTAVTLRNMGYDAWVPGNHEFNFGMDPLMKAVNDCDAPATASESQVKTIAANLIKDGSASWEPFFNAYITRTFGGVKVGVIGFCTPFVPKWDKPANWEGITFKNFVETFNRYEDHLKNVEKCDVIIAACHSGVEGSVAGTPGENQIRALIASSQYIDFATGGHSHGTGNSTVNNKNGKPITIQFAGSGGNRLAYAVFTYDVSAKTVSITANALTTSASTAAESKVTAALQPYEDILWSNYLLTKLGTASGNFTMPTGLRSPSSFMDFVNKVQMESVGAEMSIGAPLNNTTGNIIPTGDIYQWQMFDLYRYENWVYCVDMTAREIKLWLEKHAREFGVSGGNVTGGGGIYHDTLYGEGVSYDIIASRPSGDRVINFRYKGKLLDLNDTTTMYKVAINNYRVTGGNDYVAYVRNNGGRADFAIDVSDTSTPIWSINPDRLSNYTEYELGGEAGQVRALIAAYIAKEGTIHPVVTSSFRVLASEPAAPANINVAVFATSDMHGRSTTTNINNGNALANSMPRIATVLANQRVTYPHNILIDNGDTLQGTLVNTYWITKKPNEVNPMIAAMIAMNYDAWNLGNHEFNYKPEQRDPQVAFAEAAGISVLSANLVLKEDGKNFKGENVTAGSPYYKPYTVKTFTVGGGTVKVGILGVGNANNHNWDVPTNYPNMQFSSLDNPTGNAVNEINKWVPIIRQEADIVVVAIHSGTGNASFNLQSQARYAAQNTSGVDLFISGHDHSATTTSYTNTAGKTVYLMNPGAGANLSRAVFNVTFGTDGKYVSHTIGTPVNTGAGTTANTDVGNATLPHYTEAKAWVDLPLGASIAGTWTHSTTSNNHVFTQYQTTDLVHKAKIWATWLSNESDGVEGATVSISSPVFTSALSTSPRAITLADILALYQYDNNALYMLEMTGAQLKSWLNALANKYTSTSAFSGSIFNMDSFYGIDYRIDVSKTTNNRVVYCWYQGAPLKDDQILRVAINSYRLSDAEFTTATGITVDDAVWAAEVDLGADRAPVPVLIGEYFTYKGTVRATDPVYAGADSKWYLGNTTPAAATITTTTLPNGSTAADYNQTLAGTGNVTNAETIIWGLASGSSLPAGLTLSTGGVISGTPTAGGTYTFTVTATNKIGSPATRALSITVIAPANITTTSLPSALIDTAYSETLAANGDEPIVWSLAEGAALPDGLTLSAAGVISGTPTVGGTVTFTVIASNGIGSPSEKELSITVNVPAAITTTVLPDALKDVAYSETLAATGDTPITWSLAEGSSLPTGFSLSADGVLSGTPTAGGVFTFTVVASNGFGSDATQALSLTVGIPPAITTTDLPNGTKDIAYSETLAATGNAPINWSLEEGDELPTGLTLSEGGVISGTPTEAGTFTFTVTASNGFGADAAQAFTVIIGIAPAITTDSLPNAIRNAAYSQTLGATGSAPIAWSLAEGSKLPTGLTLSADGVISGAPTVNGRYTFTVVASNGFGDDATQALSIAVGVVTSIATASLPNASKDTAYSRTLSASGSAPITWSPAEVSSLPTGLTLSEGGVISGTPTEGGVFAFTVTASNGFGAVATQTLTLIVTAPPVITTDDLPDAEAGKAYSQTLVAACYPPATWRLADGDSLPEGLTLSAEGVISGTPTEDGDFTFTVVATNGIGVDVTLELSITVSPAEITTAPVITTDSRLPNAAYDTAYNVQLEAEGDGTIVWSLAKGSLPKGLTLSADGLLSGTPELGGVFTFTVKASNGAETDTELELTFFITRRGDANCDNSISAADAAIILRYLVELSQLSELGLLNAKVTSGSGAVSAADAAKILRYLVQLEQTL